MENGTDIVNALTVDVEDYFHVTALEPHIPRSAWGRWPVRVEANTRRVLELLGRHGARATFFVLGWVAERFPGLVREIAAAGHEVASHGWDHRRLTGLTPEDFRRDVLRARILLEDVTGMPVRGYRAPSFSITARTRWAHAVLAETGHAYSSSVYPVRHDLYGMPEAPRGPYRPVSGLVEVPVTTVRIAGLTLPAGGGGFFRLYPYALSRWALRRVNRREGRPAVFYFHPWELDPAQPRPQGLGLRTRVRHYLNLERMEDRLGRLLADFRWDRMDRIYAGPGPGARASAAEGAGPGAATGTYGRV